MHRKSTSMRQKTRPTSVDRWAWRIMPNSEKHGSRRGVGVRQTTSAAVSPAVCVSAWTLGADRPFRWVNLQGRFSSSPFSDADRSPFDSPASCAGRHRSPCMIGQIHIDAFPGVKDVAVAPAGKDVSSDPVGGDRKVLCVKEAATARKGSRDDFPDRAESHARPERGSPERSDLIH
jgi:hypothetical protein